MEKLEVKYEPSFPTDRMMKFERMPDDDDNDDVGFHGTTKKAGGKDKKNGWVSFVLASLALVTGLVLLTLVITWLWGIPELVSRHSRLFKEMADRLETQADQIRELERKIGEIGSSQHLKVSVCKLPAEAGSCTGSAQRWHYNSEAGSCQQFSYSGCGGNANNFHTMADCKRSCGESERATAAEAEVDCSLPKDMGPCRSTVLRWYYDHQEGKCKDFTWGGCAGNQNNFASQEKCQEKCQSYVPKSRQLESQVPELCSLPPQIGSCRAAFQMFYYDGESKECKPFIYGGCEGNENRFETMEECTKTCKP